MTVEIRKDEIKAFLDICGQYGVSCSRFLATSRFRDEQVYKCTLETKISQDWRIITQHIMSQRTERECSIYASVFYSLYSTGYLLLKNHPYSSVDSWRYDFRGYELDHKMPKWYYPELTFDPNNWQPLTKEANRNKKARVLVRESKEHMSRIADQLCDDLTAMKI